MDIRNANIASFIESSERELKEEYPEFTDGCDIYDGSTAEDAVLGRLSTEDRHRYFLHLFECDFCSRLFAYAHLTTPEKERKIEKWVKNVKENQERNASACVFLKPVAKIEQPIEIDPYQSVIIILAKTIIEIQRLNSFVSAQLVPVLGGEQPIEIAFEIRDTSLTVNMCYYTKSEKLNVKLMGLNSEESYTVSFYNKIADNYNQDQKSRDADNGADHQIVDDMRIEIKYGDNKLIRVTLNKQV